MKDKIKKALIKYAIALAIGAGLALLCLSLNEYSGALEAVERYRLLADAFTVPGIVLVLVAGLVFVSTEGFFDMLSFGFKKAGEMLIPFMKHSKESFYDYKMRKSGNRLSGYSFIFFTGLGFMAVAVVFLILYFQAAGA